MIGTILLLAICQQPLPQATAGYDVIQLKNGNELEGRILKEIDDYIEIQLAEGTVMGIDRSMAAAIIRAASAEREEEPEADDERVYQRRDDWRILHDGDGEPVGWLHETLTRGEEGEYRIGEEWSFADEKRSTEMTFLEILDVDHRPLSCFYRERSRRRGASQVDAERIVMAKVVDGKLEVSRKSTHGKSESEYESPADLRFPLELREDLRHRGSSKSESESFDLFDPREEQLLRRSYRAGASRSVIHEDKVITVNLLESETSSGQNVEWMDGLGNSIRREVNGPALVALPSSEVLARHHARERVQRFQKALQVSNDERFGMWLPNPNWVFGEEEFDDRITASAAHLDASVSMMRVEQLEPGLALESGAEAVLRWLRLLYPGLSKANKGKINLRGVAGVEYRGTYNRPAPGTRSRSYFCELVVLKVSEEFYAITIHGPREHEDVLSRDMDSILSRLELHRESIKPQLAGPLRRN
ncbi:MAG: hypothetical protein ACYTG5_15970 [Planctomycetota bacterium]|jgi:hypothetical protein